MKKLKELKMNKTNKKWSNILKGLDHTLEDYPILNFKIILAKQLHNVMDELTQMNL